jgi:ribosomal-protein-alanine N-acetyltransferase
MSAAVKPRTEIRLMQPSDLKAVAAVERTAYDYPWSLGIFRDCLLAGYYCLVLDVGSLVAGYGIMSIAAAEAHLLNICVHPASQRLGYGRRVLNALLVKAQDTDVRRFRADRNSSCLLSSRERS